MNNWTHTVRPIVLALILTAGRGLAGTLELNQNAAPAPTELTLGNFFSEGWNEDYSIRHSLPDGAPDLALLHAVTNFVVRVSRTDYYYQNNLDKSPTKNVQFLDDYVDYALNQRFMLTLFGNYTWLNEKSSPNTDGAGGGAMARVQLVSTPTASYDLNLRVDLPDGDIGVHETKISTSVSGWQDLSRLGLGRLGIYYSLVDEAYAGYNAPGTTRNDLAYDLSFAETWTKRSAPLGYLSTFVEFSGGTKLDGIEQSLTKLAVTPGIQCHVGKHNVFMFGVDFPLTHPSDSRDIYRLTYIYCF